MRNWVWLLYSFDIALDYFYCFPESQFQPLVLIR